MQFREGVKKTPTFHRYPRPRFVEILEKMGVFYAFKIFVHSIIQFVLHIYLYISLKNPCFNELYT